MRIVVIGGTGHIGSFLVPRLVRAGHEVVSVSRGDRSPYTDAPEWDQIERIRADREAEDRDGVFARRIADLGPDVVIDLVCFTVASATALVEGLRGNTGQLLHCGSIWRYGPSASVPIVEGSGTAPFGDYGVQKDQIARLLQQETADGGLVTTSLHPGHIVGPGWAPINPLGNLDLGVWRTLALGSPLHIPGLGAELLHHVHADDVAQAFELAVANRDRVAGEDLNVTSAAAVTVRGYADVVAGWFGRSAELESVTWEHFRAETPTEHADITWEHLVRSHCASIDKARSLLGYEPAYTSTEAVLESVRSLVARGELDVPEPRAALNTSR